MDEPTLRGQPPVAAAAKAGAQPEPLRLGRRYRPIALLGSGGMGSVYLAHDEELGERLAVKVLLPRFTSDSNALRRFRDEVRIARTVSSPLVARTHDLGEHEGRWFVTMQYVEGETLSARLSREGRLSLFDVLAITRDICDGLEAVHAAGVVHRDLKPSNVLLSRDGRAVLADFGIAVRVDANRTHSDASGTPAYAAPEQLVGAAVDARADLFALGGLLYAMLTGTKPFLTRRTGEEPPPDPRRACAGISDAIAAVVVRAMACDPRERFASVGELRRALEDIGARAATTGTDRLGAFVRALGAGRTRRVWVETDDGGGSALARAARLDLLARLRARDDVRVVGDVADAEAVLSLRLDGTASDVVAELALRSVEEGYEFWRDVLRGTREELPRLVEVAAHAVERAFSPDSTPLREWELFPSAEVAELVVEARSEYRAFWSAPLGRCVALLERARELAPDHPLVLAWCVSARNRFALLDPAQDNQHDEALAQRAVALAPDLPEARLALATCHVRDMRPAAAVTHLIKAIQIAPGAVEQRTHLARLLQECGAVEPALALAESTFEADPTHVEPLALLMRHHALRGRLDLAEAALARGGSATNAFVRAAFARCCVWVGDVERFERAHAAIAAEPLDPEARAAFAALRSVLAGERSGVVLDVQPRGPRRKRAFVHQMHAEILALTGDRGACRDALERAVGSGLFDIQWLDTCPLFDPLRGSVGFELLRRTVHDRAIDVVRELDRCL